MFKRCILFIIVCCLFSAPAFAVNQLPGEGVVVKPARATWTTGFFHAALVQKGLEELGYKVKKSKDLANALAYKSLSMGDIDYFPNGWFPLHDSFMGGNFSKYAKAYGYVLKAGGLQGYMVSKSHAERLNITSLADFKRPEVLAEFDKDGDGKAEMNSCPPGWQCERVIDSHLKIFGLEEFIKPNKAAYEAGIASAISAYKAGEGIFFYGWTPNWTAFTLTPGKDVVWINIPKAELSEKDKENVYTADTKDLEGAVSNPVRMGFATADIRIVANTKFAEANPAARRFFELFTVPLEDLNKQNYLMYNGEKSNKDIQRHADEWIANNKKTWEGWLTEARNAAQ